MTQTETRQLCPFCTFFEIEPDPIGNDFFGTPAKIGDVRCCEACYNTITGSDQEQEMLAWYREMQENLRGLYQSLVLQFEKEAAKPANIPIGDTYCWDHVDEPDGGGWCCAVCWREQQQEVK